MPLLQTRLLLLPVIIVTLGASWINAAPWRFAVVGDSHVPSSDTIAEMLPQMRADNIEALFLIGDLTEGGIRATSNQLTTQLSTWKTVMQGITDYGIPIYAIRGNHEADVADNLSAWNSVFSGSAAFPNNGPIGETNLTYSLTRHNALFIMLDQYTVPHRVNQEWLDLQLSQNTRPHVFTFGHEAAFKVFHSDILGYDSLPELSTVTARDTFWKSLTNGGGKVYFSGHDHFFDLARIDDGDGNSDNDLLQCVVGTGGGWRMSKYKYNGTNSGYTPSLIYHDMEHGYILVEVSGTEDSDRTVTLTWKHRVLNEATGAVTYEENGYDTRYTLPATTSSAPQIPLQNTTRSTKEPYQALGSKNIKGQSEQPHDGSRVFKALYTIP